MEHTVKELSKYRFECAEEALEDAGIMFENKRYKNTLNRAYYAIFYAIRSVNALDEFDSSKHKGGECADSSVRDGDYYGKE